MKMHHRFLGALALATALVLPSAHAAEKGVLDIYLVRHGQTNWNLEKKLQGATDNALNETGTKQANELGQKLAGVKFDQIYSSGLRRAKDTAAAFAGSAKVTPMPELNERSFGKFEGIYEDERSAAEFAEFGKRVTVLDDSLDGGESLQSQATRVQTAVNSIRQQHGKGGNIAIVAHGGVNPLVLSALLDIPVAEAVSRIKQGNDEVYLVRLREGQSPSVWKQVVRGTLEQL
ncbi:histidine phosphatase family protein [Diaphorobacter sp. HDW4A]|uniref:histidine phosphatase family protein n=1 Tax=Diaphorobacter sp. HDW4A TaxID=2714924 RepID=UPI0014081BCE|nr:histidine phosphatase family protein [Diaphorobacter sp. HDW4A]QIL82626.1 histidine phosphatase family protein [Diaphorobacter sp. HDW4A]